MRMITYMYDPADKFQPGDEAVRGAYLVTFEPPWEILDPLPDVMPKGSKQKPKCRRCRKVIHDKFFWYLDERTYCRACGDKEIAPHCVCGCKRPECPVFQATGGRHQFPYKRSEKAIKKPGKKAPAPQSGGCGGVFYVEVTIRPSQRTHSR